MIKSAIAAALAISLIGCPGIDPVQPVDDDSSKTIIIKDTDPDTSPDCPVGYYDASTELCWQVTPSEDSMSAIDALAYCDDLVIGDSSDWRLPTLDELRSLIRGCDSTMPGGVCPITYGYYYVDNSLPGCEGCEAFQGPADEGCYWPAELEGDCFYQTGDTDDPQVFGRYYVSSTPTADVGGYTWMVMFHEGRVRAYNSSFVMYRVRCVR